MARSVRWPWMIRATSSPPERSAAPSTSGEASSTGPTRGGRFPGEVRRGGWARMGQDVWSGGARRRVVRRAAVVGGRRRALEHHVRVAGPHRGNVDRNRRRRLRAARRTVRVAVRSGQRNDDISRSCRSQRWRRRVPGEDLDEAQPSPHADRRARRSRGCPPVAHRMRTEHREHRHLAPRSRLMSARGNRRHASWVEHANEDGRRSSRRRARSGSSRASRHGRSTPACTRGARS